MEVYRHSQGNEDPELVDIEATALVRELLIIEDGDGGDQIWIEEQDEAVELDITLESAGIHHRHHVHHGRCRTVDVQIRFNGERTRNFRQIFTIRQVFDWATGPGAFNLTPEQKAKHVLALPGADHFLDGNVRVGSLVTAGTCGVVLDLLPKERFQG
jgi:hypothetical protein